VSPVTIPPAAKPPSPGPASTPPPRRSGGKFIWIAIAVLIVVGLAAPKVWPLIKGTKAAGPSAGGSAAAPKSGAAKGGSAPAGPVMRVAAMTIKTEPLAEIVESTGTLRADEAVELLAEVNGKIAEINFKEGSPVKKGDLLMKLNDADLRATLQRAVYRRQLAELKEKRLASLLKDGGAKQEDFDIAANELNVQRAEVELIEAQIAKTEIRAPFDGMVGLRFVSEGAFVNATARLATLQSIDHLKVDFSVPEKYASRVRSGSPIAFSVSGSDQKFKGEIYAIEPRIDVTTRTVLLRAVCPNPEKRLLPGAFASVEFTLSQIDEAILVPTTAVIPGLSEKNVFVVKDGKAVRRAVQTGTRTERAVQIVDGIKPGEIVITSGLQQLRNGQNVQAQLADARDAATGPGPGGPKAAEAKTDGGVRPETARPETAQPGRAKS
jgi:membrane fusion protein, multidrug efflux system